MHSYQGGHISNDQEYKNITNNGKKIHHKPFDMIRATAIDSKLPTFGAWHDAA
ncbi:MAG: hypothetical protein MK132_21440 [Lentisphaerales bacterium]|nr:hypothetical protein [Lentisphaerales bacterium]